MSWERVVTPPRFADQVTVSWRIPGGRATPTLAVSLGRSICERLGLEKNDKGAPVPRVIVERDRMSGKLRVQRAAPGMSKQESRHVAWKDKACTITVPLTDVKLEGKKPAQDVPWSFEDGWLVVKLPHWACPLIQVSGKAA
jgi:hypothetical protein